MTKKHILVAPSILSGDFINMGNSVKAIKIWGGDLVHCDVMDGVYVKNLTFGMPMVAAIKKISELPLDVHLMITKPERYAEEFIKAGADILTFHPDASDCPLQTLRLIRAKGAKCGIVINPNVLLEDWKHLLCECDVLVIMSVFAGYGGQKFMESALLTIKEAAEYIKENELNVAIEVDGGITEENAQEVVAAGATMLVAGSSVYKSPDPRQTITKLKGR